MTDITIFLDVNSLNIKLHSHNKNTNEITAQGGKQTTVWIHIM